jgi:hypothetical protein
VSVGIDGCVVIGVVVVVVVVVGECVALAFEFNN